MKDVLFLAFSRVLTLIFYVRSETVDVFVSTKWLQGNDIMGIVFALLFISDRLVTINIVEPDKNQYGHIEHCTYSDNFNA